MSKRITLAVLILAASAVSTLADDRWGRGGQPGYGNDRYSYGTSDGRYRRVDPVNATLRDLRSVWSRNRVDHHEAGHFRNASEALDRFQHQASRGRFDRGQLDRAIDNLKDLAQADQIHPRDRQVLRSRLFELRAMREDGFRHRY